MTRSFWSAPVIAMIAGLGLMTAGAAGWVTGIESTDVGGVVVDESVATSGTEFAPLTVAFGLAGLFGGALLAVTRSMVRRIVGGAVAAAGAGAVVAVAVGVLGAARAEGDLTPAPFLALAAAAGVVVGGLAGLRGANSPAHSSRYRVADERPADDEWSLAAPDDDPPA